MNNIIGARKLSKEEVKLILPTYDKIFDQIKEIRSSNDNESKATGQKTNNIGILGCRGAGKTSALKTIIEELKQLEEEDIILPIIIPENMSESSTLMATVLGLFKDKVEELHNWRKRKKQ
jgi:predicted AAA+ superfamily ATPase